MSRADTTAPKQQIGRPFEPGKSGNPKGRPKGSRNKLGEDFISALQDDFAKHGRQAIVTVREERPHEYLKVIGSIVPKELHVTTNAVTEMSDDELASALAALEHLVAQNAARERGEEATTH